MKWFTSDLHIGDLRLNLYGRDLIASNSDEIDALILNNYNKLVSDDDVVYFLGDIVYDQSKLDFLSKFKGIKILILGNYDEKIPKDLLNKYFDFVYNDLTINVQDLDLYLNHYPEKCSEKLFNLTGHIHGNWRVQRNMINVGVDAWHLCPLSEDNILFLKNAIEKYYDINVFAGELKQNLIK